MSAITVIPGFPATITSPGSDSVVFLGTGTLNIDGTAQAPITVSLSSVTSASALDAINLAYADVTFSGALGASALVQYSIGPDSTLDLESTVGVAVGTGVSFTAPNSHLVLGSAADLSVLGGIGRFGPGSNIDLKGIGFASYGYSDNAGSGTGGTLTLRDSGGHTTGTVTLTSGDFTAASFNVHGDGGGGTLIDVAPAVASVSVTPANGDLDAGATVRFQLGMTAAVAVSGGTPVLVLNDGGTASYDAAHSTPTSLAFTYVVQPGDNTADLAVTGSTLNGATITDGAGNAADLTGAVGNPAGVLQIQTTPAVTSVGATPADGDLTVGGSIVLQVNLSAPVTVTGGTPTLALSDGGTAVYDAADSTPTMLTFRNTVQAGQNTPDLGVTAGFLNGAVIADAGGHTVNLGDAVGNPAGTLEVDTTAPTAINFAIDGSLEAGSQVHFTFTYSEVVIKTGPAPEFFLSNGGTANYDAALSGPTTSVFTYTAQPGDTTNDIVIVGFDPHGNVATDRAGNLLDDKSVMQAMAAEQGNFSDVSNGSTSHTIDVYRFFDQRTGTHFYTQDVNERATVLNTRPDLIPEGPNGVGLTAVDPASNDPTAVPVYRFFDLTQGTHFFTASATERDAVMATRHDLVYEPSSTFYEHATPQAGDTAVYRFFDQQFGTHFYTADASERAMILQTRPDLIAEGIGFYEPARNPAV